MVQVKFVGNFLNTINKLQKKCIEIADWLESLKCLLKVKNGKTLKLMQANKLVIRT